MHIALTIYKKPGNTVIPYTVGRYNTSSLPYVFLGQDIGGSGQADVAAGVGGRCRDAGQGGHRHDREEH